MDEKREDMLTIQEVLDYLKISRTTLHRLRKEGLIPTYKVGGSVRFKLSDINEFLKKQKQ